MILDLTDARAREDVMHAVSRDLPVPGYFGHNWDALADILRDEGLWPDGATLTVRGFARLNVQAPTVAAVLWDVLQEACIPVMLEDS